MEPRRKLDWDLLKMEPHRGVQKWIDDLNRAYRNEPALHRFDCNPRGFQWIDCRDSDQSVLTFLRKGERWRRGHSGGLQFHPRSADQLPRGTTPAEFWEKILNSDAAHYGGSGWGNLALWNHRRSPLTVSRFPSISHCRRWQSSFCARR